MNNKDFKIKAYIPISITLDTIMNAFSSLLGLKIVLMLPNDYVLEKEQYTVTEIKELLTTQKQIQLPSFLFHLYLYNLKIFRGDFGHLTVFLDDCIGNNHCLKIKRVSFIENDDFLELSLKDLDSYSFAILNSLVELFGGVLYIEDKKIKNIEIKNALYQHELDEKIKMLKEASKNSNFKVLIEHKASINILRLETKVPIFPNDLKNYDYLNNDRLSLISLNKNINSIFTIDINKLIEIKKEYKVSNNGLINEVNSILKKIN